MNAFLRKISIEAGSIIGAFLVFWLIFYFLGGSIASLSSKVATDRAQANSRSRVLDNLSSLKNDSAQAEIYRQKFAALLPPQDALLAYPNFLEDVGRLHNVEINFNFSPPPVSAQGGQPGYISFDLRVSGQASDIKDFMSDIESKAPRFMTNLDSVDMVANGAGSYGTLMHGKVFFQ